jgi:hypothetical protein
MYGCLFYSLGKMLSGGYGGAATPWAVEVEAGQPFFGALWSEKIAAVL